jgi:hypothetical protein
MYYIITKFIYPDYTVISILAPFATSLTKHAVIVLSNFSYLGLLLAVKVGSKDYKIIFPIKIDKSKI